MDKLDMMIITGIVEVCDILAEKFNMKNGDVFTRMVQLIATGLAETMELIKSGKLDEQLAAEKVEDNKVQSEVDELDRMYSGFTNRAAFAADMLYWLLK